VLKDVESENCSTVPFQPNGSMMFHIELEPTNLAFAASKTHDAEARILFLNVLTISDVEM